MPAVHMRGGGFLGLKLALLAGLLSLGACSGETRDNQDAGAIDGAAMDAAVIDASEASEASLPTGACNDSTGDLACCPADAVEGASCSATATPCGTRCVQGVHGHMYCSGGVWGAGHGLFPCGAAAGQSGSVRADAGADD